MLTCVDHHSWPRLMARAGTVRTVSSGAFLSRHKNMAGDSIVGWLLETIKNFFICTFRLFFKRNFSLDLTICKCQSTGG